MILLCHWRSFTQVSLLRICNETMLHRHIVTPFQCHTVSMLQGTLRRFSLREETT